MEGFDPDKRTALIVVDMQRGFLEDDSAMGRIGFNLSLLRAVIDPCAEAVAVARRAGIPVIWTRYVYEPDYSDGGVMVDLLPALKAEGALRRGDAEIEIHAAYAVAPEDVVIDKSRPSAFFDTGLDAALTELGVTQLMICGITTNCCVESTVRDAAHRNIATFVLTDAVAETDPMRHEYALKAMGMLFARLATVAQFAAAV